MSGSRLHWPGWIESGWDALRSSYWFIPSLMAVLAAVVAQVLIELDHRVPSVWIARLPWIFAATAEGTRATLSVVAGSMITVTGVVFSITIVALTLASNQFGPRLLRNFIRDRINQFVLGSFVATFLYSLLVLRAVQAHGDVAFVPHIATGGAVALGAGSLFVLILFIHHASSSIQASSVIAQVSAEIQAAIPERFPDFVGEVTDDPVDSELLARVHEQGSEVCAPCAGYIRVIDVERLLDVATEHDGCIAIERRSGDFACAGSPLARVLVPGGPSEDMICQVRDAFVLGDHRTPVQDLLFPVEQLAEMAVRALSSGINDPRTAIACIQRLGDALAALGERSDPSPYRRDERGNLRLITPVTSFEDVIVAGFDPIRRYGVQDPTVCVALLEAFGVAMARGVGNERREQILACARAILVEGRERVPSERDRETIAAAGNRLGFSPGSCPQGPSSPS